MRKQTQGKFPTLDLSLEVRNELELAQAGPAEERETAELPKNF